MSDYDSVDGIGAYLVDLAGLRRLDADRHQAGYDRHERLNEFMVLGRFYLDTCGNFSLSTFRYDYKDHLDWLPDSLPKVIRLSELRSTLSKLIISSVGHMLPGPEDWCIECGDGWDLSNCHDAIGKQAPAGSSRKFDFEHDFCNRLAAERQQMQEYRQCVDEAGLGRVLLTPIPNEYEGDEGAPWCLMRTPKGAIKFGWRKRVINVDWSDVVERRTKGLHGYDARDAIQKAFDANTLFPGDDVTKGLTHIHAYGPKKLVEYLRKLSEVMKIGHFLQVVKSS